MSEVKKQIDNCDARIAVADADTLTNAEKFKEHFFPNYTFDPSFNTVSPSCKGEDSVLNNNQLSVYIMARCRALNKTVAPGLLVNHGTGSGKTLIGVLIMLSFWDAQHQMIMAINATDTGDLPLALVHMKRALAAINYSIGLTAGIPSGARLSAAEAAQDIESTLFDLREVCLRVMADCRWDGKKK
jgi:hypothetical protein